jgi:hypothetical protein
MLTELIHFHRIRMSLLMSLVLSLMPMEPRLAPFTAGAPLEAIERTLASESSTT